MYHNIILLTLETWAVSPLMHLYNRTKALKLRWHKNPQEQTQSCTIQQILDRMYDKFLIPASSSSHLLLIVSSCCMLSWKVFGTPHRRLEAAFNQTRWHCSLRAVMTGCGHVLQMNWPLVYLHHPSCLCLWLQEADLQVVVWLPVLALCL